MDSIGLGFCGQTRTNQPSCAVAAVQIVEPTITAIKDATKYLRIDPSEAP